MFPLIKLKTGLRFVNHITYMQLTSSFNTNVFKGKKLILAFSTHKLLFLNGTELLISFEPDSNIELPNVDRIRT